MLGFGFGFAEALAAITAESRRLTEVVASHSSDLDRQVPSCPEWSVRDLGHHIGEVQWSWAENVRARNAEVRSGASLTALPPDDELVSWMGSCTESLVGALTESGPDAPCWTWWAAPRTTGAVARHQAQEAAVHRWDAEGVAAPGAGAPLPADLAGDGVPEFVEIMIGPDAEVLSGAVTLVASDLGDRWRVAGAGAAARPGATKEAELKATASDLVLMLYRRLPVPDADVVGDPLLVASMLSLADTT